MAYLKKNIETLIDIKITDKGRELISTGKFCNIEYFQVGDSEFDYKNEDIFKRDGKKDTQIVFRAKDKDSDVKYPIPVGSENPDDPLSCNTYGRVYPNHQEEVVSKKVEFLGVTQNQNIKTPLGICVPLMNFDGSDTLVTNKLISCEYILIKFPQDPSNVLDTDGPCLWYKVVSFIDENTIQLDRPLPNYSFVTDLSKEATLFEYAKRETTEYLDFNVAWTEEFAGFDVNLPRTFAEGSRYLSTKEMFGYTSYEHGDNYYSCNPEPTTTTTTTICPPEFLSLDLTREPTVQLFSNVGVTGESWDYCSSYVDSYGKEVYVYPDEQKFIGVIHYTKWEDYYGTGEWWKEFDSEFELNLPTLMYHRDGDNKMGHKFKMGSINNYVKSLVNDEMDSEGEVYFDLIDTTNNQNIVGKIFPHKQAIVIDDEEILMALSMKSNRNWTLPAPKAVRISSDADCIDSPDDVMLPKDLTKQVFISYMFYNKNNKMYSAPSAQYVRVDPSGTDDFDVAVSFKDGFNFLRDKIITDNNPGFQATNFYILVQQVDTKDKPSPDEWRYIEYTDSLNGFVGGNILSSHLTGTKFIVNSELYNNADAFNYRQLIGYPNQNERNNLIFGDEFMLMGDVTLNKQHSVYVMNYIVDLPSNKFIRSQNPTWDQDTDAKKQDLYITEVALYNDDKDMVAIGKVSKPHKRKVDPASNQVISVKLDF
jgi:hypothetical protein